MKAILRSLGVVLMVATLTACGQSPSEKAKEKVDNANVKIARVNELNQTLYGKGINLNAWAKPTSAPAGLTQAEVDETVAQLKEFNRVGGEVLNAANDSQVIFTDSDKLRAQMLNAMSYLAIMENYVVKPAKEPTKTILARMNPRLKFLEDETKLFLAKYFVDLNRSLDSKSVAETTNRKWIEAATTEQLKEMKSKIEDLISTSDLLFADYGLLSGREDVRQDILEDSRLLVAKSYQTTKENLTLVTSTLQKKQLAVNPIAVGQ